MHTHLRLTQRMPLVPLAFVGFASLGGCFGRAVTIEADPQALTDNADGDSDAGYSEGGSTDASGHADGPGKGDASQGAGMRADAFLCTNVTARMTTQTAPDGKTWILDLKGTCGTLGIVEAFITSKDNVAYPQSCSNVGFVRASIGAEGDAGQLAYDSSATRGSCSIAAGPSTANQATPVSIEAVVENAQGNEHTLSYRP